MVDSGSRLTRWRGLVGVAGQRLRGKESGQVALNTVGIALPVALMLIVTSVSLGLAMGTTVRSAEVDYWIVPESGSARSAIVSVSGPQFGRVHSVSDRLTARNDVTYASPVLMELVSVRAGDTEEYVLAIGVVPREQGDRYAGVSTDPLTPGDPYFANGEYNGSWTGEAVLSAAGVEVLNTSRGATLSVTSAEGRTNRTLTVVNVSQGKTGGLGQFPVMVMHLSELQALTGATAGDQGDQLLVKTTTPSAKKALEDVYPNSLVLSRSGLATRQVFRSQLPLAMSVTALITALVVGVLFAASTMGLEIASDSRNRAVLATVGVSGRSRAVLITAQALIVAFLGGILGVGVGVAGIPITNRIIEHVYADVTIAQFHPGLVVYGFGVVLLIGGLTVPYLLFVSRRTTTIEHLRN